MTEVHGPYRVGLWKYIRKGVGSSLDAKLEVGDSSKIKFWRNLWCGDRAPDDGLPTVHRIACEHEVSMGDSLEVFGGSPWWNVSFLRAMDWEIGALIELFNYWTSSWRHI